MIPHFSTFSLLADVATSGEFDNNPCYCSLRDTDCPSQLGTSDPVILCYLVEHQSVISEECPLCQSNNSPSAYSMRPAYNTLG